MKLNLLLCAAIFSAVCLSSLGRAADETPKPSAADAAKMFSPTDLDALRGAMGQTVSVEGTIVASGESKTKTVRYLNFTKNYKESLGLVFFVSKGGEEFSLDRLSAWVGKKVRATGKVSEHTGSLQIEVEKWDQVQEVK
jgi:RecJ-like exonuclease